MYILVLLVVVGTPPRHGSAHGRGPSHSGRQCTPLAKVASEFKKVRGPGGLGGGAPVARGCWLAGKPEAEARDPLPGAVTRSLGFGPSGSLLGSVGYA
jgi:hypothetical protein